MWVRVCVRLFFSAPHWDELGGASSSRHSRDWLSERLVDADETPLCCDIDQDEALERNTFTPLLCALFEQCSLIPSGKFIIMSLK